MIIICRYLHRRQCPHSGSLHVSPCLRRHKTPMCPEKRWASIFLLPHRAYAAALPFPTDTPESGWGCPARGGRLFTEASSYRETRHFPDFLLFRFAFLSHPPTSYRHSCICPLRLFYPPPSHSPSLTSSSTS